MGSSLQGLGAHRSLLWLWKGSTWHQAQFLLYSLGRSLGIWKAFLQSCGVAHGSINTVLKESIGVINHSNPNSFWMGSDTSALGGMSKCLAKSSYL